MSYLKRNIDLELKKLKIVQENATKSKQKLKIS